MYGRKTVIHIVKQRNNQQIEQYIIVNNRRYIWDFLKIHGSHKDSVGR